MKKYRGLRFILFLFTIITFQIIPMEQAYVIHDNICYFTQLPVELLNYIAKILMWESEKEFIERTNVVVRVPCEYYTFFPAPTNRCLARKKSGDDGPSNILGVTSPDGNKIALFELLCGNCSDPNLVIIDREKEKREEKVIYNKQLSKENYLCLGISCSGNMIATVQKRLINDGSLVKAYQDYVVVQNLAANKAKFFSFPSSFTPLRFAFNKQGTHVIAYGNDIENCSKVVQARVIFSLKKSGETVDEKKILIHYFKHRGICKTI